MVSVAWVSCRFREEGGQINSNSHSILFYFFLLAITFNEGPRGIFDFCMSSLLSACWKMDLEDLDGLHKKANASLRLRLPEKKTTNHKGKKIPCGSVSFDSSFHFSKMKLSDYMAAVLEYCFILLSGRGK